MKQLSKICLLSILIFGVNRAARAQSGTICGNPSEKNCVGQYDDFKPYDLIFNTGRDALGTGTRHESNEFYAVILKSVKAKKTGGAGCNFISENKRRTAQTLFPKNRVFASRQSCGRTIIRYENANEQYNFMAIYAGATNAGADKILNKPKKTYPSANIRKLKVVLDFADE